MGVGLHLALFELVGLGSIRPFCVGGGGVHLVLFGWGEGRGVSREFGISAIMMAFVDDLKVNELQFNINYRKRVCITHLR